MYLQGRQLNQQFHGLMPVGFAGLDNLTTSRQTRQVVACSSITVALEHG
jgi:hypothetical protein